MWARYLFRKAICAICKVVPCTGNTVRSYLKKINNESEPLLLILLKKTVLSALRVLRITYLLELISFQLIIWSYLQEPAKHFAKSNKKCPRQKN